MTAYDYYIEATLQKIGRGHIRPVDVEDLKQSVYLRLIQHHALERYDPERGSFQNFLFQAIRSVAINTFQTNVRRPLNCALGLVTQHPGVGQVVLDGPDHQDTRLAATLEARDTIRRLAQVASGTKDGAALVRMLQLLVLDQSSREIAEATGCSARVVAQQRQKLRKLLTTRLKVKTA